MARGLLDHRPGVAGYDFEIGQDDDGVLWAFPVFDAYGKPVDVTGATQVLVHFRIDDDSAPAVDLTGAVVPQTAGPAFAGHVFHSSEIAVPGVYLAQALITLEDGTRMTYPEERKMRVLVESEA